MSYIGKNGVVEIPASKGGITVKITWQENVNPDSGTSKIEIIGIEAKSRKWYGVSYFLDGSISVDSADIQSFNKSSQQHYFYWGSLNTYAPIRTQKGGVNVPWLSDQIGRNADGLKTVRLRINISGYTLVGGTDSGWNASDDITIELTPLEQKKPITEIQQFTSAFFFGGIPVMVIKNRKPIVATFKPGKIPNDHSIIGKSVLGVMILGKEN